MKKALVNESLDSLGMWSNSFVPSCIIYKVSPFTYEYLLPLAGLKDMD